MKSLHLRLLTTAIPLLILPVAAPASLFPQESALAQDGRVVQATDAAARLAAADRLLQQGIQQYRVSQFRAAFQSWQRALELYRDPAVQAAFP